MTKSRVDQVADPDQDLPWKTIDLAIREYLAIREEMNGLLRLELNLVMTAFLVAVGAIAALASDFTKLDDVPRGLAFMVAAAFGLGVFIIAIGVANAFFVLEAYATLAAERMRKIDGLPDLGAIVSLQGRIRRTFTHPSGKRDRVAWLISYGSTPMISILGVVLLAFAGFAGWFASEHAKDAAANWRTVLGVLDLVLLLTGSFLFLTSLFYVTRWDEVIGDREPHSVPG